MSLGLQIKLQNISGNKWNNVTITQCYSPSLTNTFHTPLHTWLYY